MSKLRKRTAKAKPAAAENAGRSRQGNPVVIAGVALAIAGFLAMMVFLSRVDEKASVVVAQGAGVPPYTALSASNTATLDVPKGSVTDEDLTPDELKKLQASGDPVVTRIEILPGQRVAKSAITPSTTGTLSVVKPSEQVIAANATFAGAVGGAVGPGSVVDVFSPTGGGGGVQAGSGQSGSSDTALLARNVKVLGVGAGAAAAAGITPPSGKDSTKGAKDSGQQSAGLIIVLAVDLETASRIIAAGQAVSMTLNPHLTFGINGNICQVGSRACNAPAAAAKPAAKSPAAAGAGTTGTGTTGTTGTGTTGTTGAGTDGQALPPSPVESTQGN